MIGMRANGDAYAILFTTPINRYFISAFLHAAPRLARGAPSVPELVQITGNISGIAEARVTTGLGLTEAVGLATDGDSIALGPVGPKIGDVNRQLPSAIVFQ